MIDIFSLFGGLGGGGPMAGVAPVAPMGQGVVANDPAPAPAAGLPTDVRPGTGGNVLAVIDPARLAAERASAPDEEGGLLDPGTMQAMAAGAGAGLGHSRWGAFAQGMAGALNAQGKYGERQNDKKSKASETAFERQLKLGQLDETRKANESRAKYYDGVLGVRNRKQDFDELPDDLSGTTSVGGRPMKLNELLLTRSRRYKELLGPDVQYPTREKHAAALKQLDTELPLPASMGGAPAAAPGAAPGTAAPAGTQAAPAAAPPSATAAAPAPTTGGPARVNTKAEYDALPSGTPYTAPDGSQRRKP